MPDYDQLLDAEMKAFVERTNSYYPPETVTFTIDQQRAVYDRMCAEFHAGRPQGVAVTDMMVPGRHRVPVRIYDRSDVAEPACVVVYFHGGGFVVGGLDSHDDVCAEICDFTGYRVVSVDYRLSPEHDHPAAFDDSMAAFDWVSSVFDGPIVVAGDSAGGNLAAAISHALRGQERSRSISIGVGVGVPPWFERGEAAAHDHLGSAQVGPHQVRHRRGDQAESGAQHPDVGAAEPLAEHVDGAAARVLVERGDADQRRLAASVEADHHPVLVGLDAPVHAVEQVAAVAGEAHADHGQRGDAHRCPPKCSRR